MRPPPIEMLELQALHERHRERGCTVRGANLTVDGRWPRASAASGPLVVVPVTVTTGGGPAVTIEAGLHRGAA